MTDHENVMQCEIWFRHAALLDLDYLRAHTTPYAFRDPPPPGRCLCYVRSPYASD